MDEGKARMKASEPARAIEAFQKANDIMHVPTTGLALAKAHLAAGHLIEAREAALEVGRLPREANEPAVLETARKHAKEMTVDLKTKIPTVKVKIKNGPASKVLVDDVEIAPSIIGEPVAVNPGKRVVIVRNAEGAEAKAEVELAEKEAKEVELTVPAHGEAPKPTPTPTPSASSASSPPPTTNPPTKREVKGFGNDDVDLRLTQRTPLAEGLIYGGFGVGVIGLGVGLVTGAMTLSKASAVEPQCENNICAPTAQGDLDSARTLATISTISVIVGVVGAGVGVIGFALPKRGAPPAAPRKGTLTILPAGIGGTF
jgi:hypothetical protein